MNEGKTKMLIAAEKISKSYTEKILLQECSFFINEGDKIGVIGINGTGKSTLLKIMAQLEEPDSGVVTTQAGARIGYLSQNPMLDENATVLEQVFSGADNQQRELQEYEAKTILNKLGIKSFEDKVGHLSGGQKKRVAMASVLITPCDILILDEPTNHLDNDMIVWLESYLIKYTGAVLMVTHDRYFLDRVITKIAEVSNGSIYLYEANYSKYLELKALREEIEIGTQRKNKSLFRKELDWISRGARARGTKSKSRIERFEQLSEKIGSAATEKLSLSSVSTRLGRKTVEINNLSKGFDQKPLIRDFDHIIAGDARIGIVGNNGSGKSTLLNLISGRLQPDNGEVVVGDTVKMGYFTQECEEMDSSIRVIDYIKSFGENIETLDGTLSASQLLEKFLFPPDLQWNTIGRLSGGERRRLYLLTIVMSAPNILLLDEPTNDLDIKTLMILEDYLEGFSGGVVVVSHDRYFLDKVANLIFEVQKDGTIKKYPGKYTDYLQNRANDNEIQPLEKAKKAPSQKEAFFKGPQKIRFTFSEQREYAVIDSEIAALEEQLAQIELDLSTQASNYELLQGLLAQQAELTEQLNKKTERWFYLNEIAAKIDQSDNS